MTKPARNSVIPLEQLTSKATAHQEYYHTKVQRQVYFTTSINLFVSLICVFVEIFIWCATNHSEKLFPWSRIHPYLVGLFFFLNLFFHCILLPGARKLAVMTLRNYILLQGFFGLMAMSLIVVLTAVNLKNHGAGIEGYGILMNRFFFAGLSVLSFISAVKMLKIAVHERSNDA